MKNKMELTATYLKASKGIVFFVFTLRLCPSVLCQVNKILAL